jgi:Na+/glutamate symporter
LHRERLNYCAAGGIKYTGEKMKFDINSLLDSTPTAMANMSAVAQRYGASHLAFIIVPLVCAFFIDLVNALLIPFFLAYF